MENFGHGIEHFIINYLNLEDDFNKPGSFIPLEKINTLANAERRILKQLDVIYQKIFGFLFPNTNDGHDLGIIRSHFIEWMNDRWNSNTGGLYVLSILKEKKIIPLRCQKRIDEKVVDLVYFENFFGPDEADNIVVQDESLF